MINKRRMESDGGQTAPLVSVAMLGLLVIAALVIDGGVLFAARRNLQSLADAAARAGAMEIDETVLREHGGRVQLEPKRAQRAAGRYLERSEFRGSASITADEALVDIRLREERSPVLMTIAGVRTLQVEARAISRVRAGLEAAE